MTRILVRTNVSSGKWKDPLSFSVLSFKKRRKKKKVVPEFLSDCPIQMTLQWFSLADMFSKKYQHWGKFLSQEALIDKLIMHIAFAKGH